MPLLTSPRKPTDPDDLVDTAAALRRALINAATFTCCELALLALERKRRRRDLDGAPPLFRPAGRAGYTDGYRDGHAAAVALGTDKATRPAS